MSNTWKQEMELANRKFVVEWASEEWGEHPTWDDKSFDTLDMGEAFAMYKLYQGNAVRVYIEEKHND